MDDLIIKSNKNSYTCSECKNENKIPEVAQEADVIECAFCGIEFRIIEKSDAGDFTLEILEEEK